MTKFLFTVSELIEAGCFTKEEYQNAYNETKEVETKPWLVFQNIAQNKNATSESLFEKAGVYFNPELRSH